MFMPRLKHLAARRLFKPAGSPEEGPFGSRSYVHLDPLFGGTIDLNLPAEQWDGVVRVAASFKNRLVRANIRVRRLASSSPTNRLAKALTHLGQLVKTIYIPRFLNDPTLRQQVRTPPNHGETRQGVAQRMCFADQGMRRSGDYFQIMTRVSCLSLLSKAVFVYKTVRMTQVLERAKAQGQECTPEDMAHISPLAYRHVIVNGTYDFSPPHPSHLQDQ